ncbi:unnamed protein product [Pleuronectes platessa]|uniref:Uncharacterized protein n=1 Tax=Pleuronectes platessa TaxID=8262 RepID=A0A9N7U9C8_PLEPL|nr:unnamed protein product [Pleuronectes platessa]
MLIHVDTWIYGLTLSARILSSDSWIETLWSQNHCCTNLQYDLTLRDSQLLRGDDPVTPRPSLALTVSAVMSSRCAAEGGGGRGETLSEGTLSGLMEWLAEAWGRGSAQGPAMKGERGAWQGRGGDRSLTLDIPQSETSTTQEPVERGRVPPAPHTVQHEEIQTQNHPEPTEGIDRLTS